MAPFTGIAGDDAVAGTPADGQLSRCRRAGSRLAICLLAPLWLVNVGAASAGVGDATDLCLVDPDNDSDGDGICGDLDNCPTAANANQADIDGDGLGDACDPDSDNDGVADGDDNCRFAANQDQADADRDGAGNVCVADGDNDGVGDATDACMRSPAGEQVDAAGCAIAQLCPCVPENGEWKNHDAYSSCVARAAEDFVDRGLIATPERDAIVTEAGQQPQCGTGT